MNNVVAVNFKENGKLYFFRGNNLIIKDNDFVIVDTDRGLQVGKVVVSNIINKENVSDMKNVIRLATQKDLMIYNNNLKDAVEALNMAKKIAVKYNLNMNLIEANYTFERNQLLFSFLSDQRIDFREMARELASIYKTRIELRQIGVRDEIRRIGGNGICGRELCCCSFLGNFETVSIKMAKEQNISLNPAKISGNCGRLMCCLKYEQEVYEEKLKRLPKVGAIVKTEDGEGTVEEVETLKEKVKVKVKDGDDYFYKKYDCSDIKIIKNIEKHKIDPEEKEHQKELEELEKLEKTDTVEDDIE